MFDLLKKSAVQITMLFVEKKSSKTMILSKLHKYAVFMRINWYTHINYYAEAARLETWKYAAHNQNMNFFSWNLFLFLLYAIIRLRKQCHWMYHFILFSPFILRNLIVESNFCVYAQADSMCFVCFLCLLLNQRIYVYIVDILFIFRTVDRNIFSSFE